MDTDSPQRDASLAPPTMKSRARGAVLGLSWGETRGKGIGRATMQALALSGAAMERRPWSLGAWVCWLLAGQRGGLWQKDDPFLDDALMRLRRGEPPERTGWPAPRLGPAARVGPLGVLLRSDPASLLKATMESTLVTHADLRAGAMAFAVAYAVARLVEGEDVVDVVGLLPNAVRGVEDSWTLPRHPAWERDHGAPHAVSESLRHVFQAFPAAARRHWDSAALRDRVCLAARPHVKRGESIRANDPFVLCGGLHGLCTALLAPLHPAELLHDVDRQGGESAPVAAIAGTVLGARYGADWIGDVPERVVLWADALSDGVGAESRDSFAGL